MFKNILATAIIAALPVLGNAATLNNQFLLDGNLIDTQGAGSASIAAGTGSLDSDSYNFAAGQGLTVNFGSTLATWSIVMDVAMDASNGYNKLIDVAGLSADQGLYNHNGRLNYYNTATGSATVFTPGVAAKVVLTYDGTTTTGYVNGAQQISFTTTGSGYPTGLSSIIAVQDDSATGGNEATSGDLQYVEVYEGALTANEVAALRGPVPPVAAVPLPAGAVLLLSGFGLLAARRRA